MSYASISDQVKFIDTIKFYQKPLHTLAASMEPTEYEKIQQYDNNMRSITKFLEMHPKFRFKYASLSVEDKKWVVNYLLGGKGVVPYEMIKQWEDLNIVPNSSEKLFAKTTFYSSLKKTMVTDQEYEDIKIKMTNLSDLNALYNFQDKSF